MKKILLVSNMWPSEEYPNYGVFVQHTYEILQDNYQVDCVVMTKCKNRWRRRINYIVWFLRILLQGIFGDYNCIYNHFVYITGPVIQVIKKFRPKIVVVENAHGGDMVPVGPEDEKKVPWAKKALPVTDVLIVPSDYYANLVAEYFSFPKEKISVSPSGGVNLNVFHGTDKIQSRRDLDFEEDCFLVGFVSRVEEQKGWDIFTNAVNVLRTRIPKIRAVVIGTGADYPQLVALREELKLEDVLILREFCPQQALCNYYSAMDVFCFPTQRVKSETLGLVGLEAMACGTGCAIADLPGPRSYANDENAVIFDSFSVDACAEALEQWYKMSAQERETKKKNALATARIYSSEQARQNLLDTFSKLL